MFSVTEFRGMAPRLDDRKLPSNFATSAENCKILSGSLAPICAPKIVSRVNSVGDIRDLYVFSDRRFPSNTAIFHFDRETDLVEYPFADDDKGRFAITQALGGPAVSDLASLFVFRNAPVLAGFPFQDIPTRVLDGQYRQLGIPRPVNAPVRNPLDAPVDPGATDAETRGYAYTFTNRDGEEGPPSPILLTDVLPIEAGGAPVGLTVETSPAEGNSGMITQALLRKEDATFFMRNVRYLMPRQVFIVDFTGLPEADGRRFRVVDISETSTEGVFQVNADYIPGDGFTNPTVNVSSMTGAWAMAVLYPTAGNKVRLYRVSGTVPSLRFVREMDVFPGSTAEIVDNRREDELGSEISTDDVLPPPADLQCLIALSNGCLAGLSGPDLNQICFSEPGRPWSWPLSNRYAFIPRGVALAASENSVIVLTDNFPIVVTATLPDAASLSPIAGESYAPCMSKEGAVDIGSGVIYPSIDGLYIATAGGVQMMTRNLYRIDEWALLNPSTFRSTYHNQHYYASHVGKDGERVMLMFDTLEPSSTIRHNVLMDGVFNNIYTGEMLCWRGKTIFRWDRDLSSPLRTHWQSGEMYSPTRVCMNSGQILADYSPQGAPNSRKSFIRPQVPQQANLLASSSFIASEFAGAELAALEIAGMQGEVRFDASVTPTPGRTGKVVQPPEPVSFASRATVRFTILADGREVFSRILDSERPFRLPTGYRSYVYAIRIEANVRVHNLAIAPQMRRLGAT